MSSTELCLHVICILGLSLLIVEWKALFPLKKCQASWTDSIVHSEFILQGQTIHSVYKKCWSNWEILWHWKSVTLSTIGLVTMLQIMRILSQLWPQILDGSPILLGLNLNELQKLPKVKCLFKPWKSLFYFKYSGDYTGRHYCRTEKAMTLQANRRDIPHGSDTFNTSAELECVAQWESVCWTFEVPKSWPVRHEQAHLTLGVYYLGTLESF